MSAFETGKIWSTSGSRYMYAYCWQTTNGSSANNSTISWTIYTKDGGSTCYDTGPTYLWIGGVQRYYKARTSWSSFAFPAAAGSTSGSYTLAHNNDGSVAAQEVSLKSAIYTGEWNSTTVTGTWTLDKIARYFSSTPSISLASRTETSITLNWSTSETCSAITWYGYKSGAKVTVTGLPGTSGTVTIGNSSVASEKLDANTTYNIYGTFRRSDSGLDSNSGTGSYTTHNYPHVTSVGTANLTIGGSQTLYLYNPMGRTVTIKMHKSDGTLLYTSGTTTGTSITFTPTATNLYDSIKTAQSASCYYSAICSSPSSTINTSTSYTYKVTGNETPTFAASNVSTYDATSAITAITGQTAAGGWLVQGLSELKITIPTAASPKNSASISKYEVTFAGTTKTVTVGTTGATWGVFNGSGEQTISIKVTDSRGLSTTVTKAVTYVAYRAPSISLTAGRANNYGETVNISATYTGSDVSGKNGVKVQWSGAGKSGYLTGSASAYDAAETGTKTATATGVNNETAYTFTATITDKFGKTATSSVKVPVGQPTMFVDVEQAGVGVNCLPTGQGLYVQDNLRVNGKRLLQKFDMDLSGLSADNFYPVVFDGATHRIDCEIYSPSYGGDHAWNQNSISFSIKGKGWSDIVRQLYIYQYSCYSGTEITIGSIANGSRNGGKTCVWLRGGRTFEFFANTKATLHTSDFTDGDEVYSVGTGYAGGAANANISTLFTPQSTISQGTYISDQLRVSGNIRGGSINSDGNIAATGQVTGNFIKASGNTEAGADIVARNGYLYAFANSRYIRVGCENASHAHYVTDAADSHWFNKTVRVAGALYKGSGYNVNVPGVYVQSTQPGATQTGDIWVI